MCACVYAIKDPGLFFGGALPRLHQLGISRSSGGRVKMSGPAKAFFQKPVVFCSHDVYIYIEILTNLEMYAKMKIICITKSIHRYF